MRKWQGWRPKGQTIGVSPDNEAPKPTKPRSVGFAGALSGETPNIEAPNQVNQLDCSPPVPGAPDCKNPRESTQDRTYKTNETSRQAPIYASGQAAPGSTDFPTKRFGACNSWLFWVSVHGAVACATCRPPASRSLVKTWYWLPEGESKKTQRPRRRSKAT